jgi:hypothetical protein
MSNGFGKIDEELNSLPSVRQTREEGGMLNNLLKNPVKVR